MKPISPDKNTVRPIKTFKAQTYTYVSGSGSNPSQLTLSVGVAPLSSPNNFDPATAQKNLDGTYANTVYYSVKTMFYNSQSLWDAGAQIISGSYFGRKYTPGSSGIYVVNVAQTAFGEEIRPGTFLLTQPESTHSIQDDGEGHLYIGDTTNVVGNVFYPLGLAVVNRMNTPETGSIHSSGLFVRNGASVNVSFRATHTIYEHQIVCTIPASEFNFSFNPTVTRTVPIAKLMLSGSLQPYMTTIGLYNNNNELLAVAKFPRPVKRLSNSDQTVIIRFDS